jgi:hypothetical protein
MADENASTAAGSADPSQQAGGCFPVKRILPHAPGHDEHPHAHLVDEYKANIELLRSDHDIRLRRNESFLRANAAMVAILALVGVAAGHAAQVVPPVTFPIVGVGVSIFGFLMCRYWAKQHLRAASFVRFHAWQLRQIEHALGWWTTFRNSHAILDLGVGPESPRKGAGALCMKGEGGDEFRLPEAARESSTEGEMRFVEAVRLLWVAIGLGFLVLIPVVAVH